jgi:hypothetical protein
VAAHDEQRIRNTHYSRITCNGPGCPGHVRHVDSERYAIPTRECRPLGPARAVGAGERPVTTAGSLHNANFYINSSDAHCRRHTRGNRAVRPAIPRAAGLADQPWRIQLSGGSDPEGAESDGGWCWQSHQVPPGQSSCWCFRHGTQIMILLCRSDPGGWFAPAWVHRGHDLQARQVRAPVPGSAGRRTHARGTAHRRGRP